MRLRRRKIAPWLASWRGKSIACAGRGESRVRGVALGLVSRGRRPVGAVTRIMHGRQSDAVLWGPLRILCRMRSVVRLMLLMRLRLPVLRATMLRIVFSVTVVGHIMFVPAAGRSKPLAGERRSCCCWICLAQDTVDQGRCNRNLAFTEVDRQETFNIASWNQFEIYYFQCQYERRTMRPKKVGARVRQGEVRGRDVQSERDGPGPPGPEER